jgi:hypothetical protein
LVSSAVLVFLSAGSAKAVDVTTCGQVIKGTGDLVSDLDCSSHSGRALQLIGRLRLNGFKITGNSAFPVVFCNIGSCTVLGPGTLTGGTKGVTSDVGVKVVDATVELNSGDGVFSFRSARIQGASVIANNGGNGVHASRTVSIVGGKLALPDVVVSGNGGDGIQAVRTVRIQDAVVSDNAGDGVETEGAASLNAAVVQGNGFDGVRALSVRLRDTTATGNRTAPPCGVTDVCADVAAEKKPALAGASTCEISRDTGTGGTWGICTLD